MRKAKYKMSTKTCHSSLPLLAVLLLCTAVFSTSRAIEIKNVCDNIVTIFNTLNEAMPLHATIPSKTTVDGMSYPSGTVTFTKAERGCKKCMSYAIKGSTILRLYVASEIKIHLPNFMYIANEINLTASAATIELHYQISESDTNDQTSLVTLRPIMTEVRELGDVQIETQDETDTDFTEKAEDILRPLLFYVADSFAKESLNFQIEPNTYDPSGAAYEAFKTIFKAYMYNLHTDVNNHDITE